jgi:hypothetical protein
MAADEMLVTWHDLRELQTKLASAVNVAVIPQMESSNENSPKNS